MRQLRLEVVRMVRTAHQRSGGNVFESFTFGDLLVERKGIGVDVLGDGQVFFTGAQILSHRLSQQNESTVQTVLQQVASSQPGVPVSSQQLPEPGQVALPPPKTSMV